MGFRTILFILAVALTHLAIVTIKIDCKKVESSPGEQIKELSDILDALLADSEYLSLSGYQQYKILGALYKMVEDSLKQRGKSVSRPPQSALFLASPKKKIVYLVNA